MPCSPTISGRRTRWPPRACAEENVVLRKSRFVHAAIWATMIAGAACAQPVFHPPGTVPSVKSALAARAPLNAVAMAGTRIVAAGQRGHVLYSDDGKTWTQADVPSSADL